MTRSDVIRLAKAHRCKTELDHGEVVEYYEFFPDGLVIFAALVEAEVRKEMEAERQQAIAAAVVVERYACVDAANEWAILYVRDHDAPGTVGAAILSARTQPAPGGAG